VTAPAQSKIYTVINATTGGFAVTLVGAGPTTGVTIANGARATVAWNGSDFVEVSRFSDLVVYGNAGIGTSSPAYKLDVSGTARITGITRTPALYGTTTGITEFMDSLGTTGMYVTGAGASPSNSIRLYSAGTLNATLDSSGNLGLGVTPSAWATFTGLQVGALGGVNIGGASGDTFYAMNAYYNAGWKYAATGTTALMYRLHNGEHKWSNAPSGTAGNAITFTQAMTLDASGNLGVGTTSPALRMHVVGSNAANNFGVAGGSYGVRIENGVTVGLTGSAITGVDNAFVNSFQPLIVNGSQLVFATSNTERARIDSSGNLLVGTTTSASKLTLNGTQTFVDGGDSRVGTIKFAFGGFNVTSAETELNLSAPYSSVVFLTGTAGTASERARIDSSGNLLVGVSTFTANTTKFVSSTSAVGSAITAQNTSGSNTNDVVLVRADRNTTNGTFTAISYYNDGAAAYKFRVFDSGNVVNTNNSYGAISDAKLKENVTDANPKLEKLQQVRVVNYNLIGSEQKQIGVIAQELEQIFPSMVEESPDRDKEGNDLGTKTKSVKYSVFVPMLIKAIQEQQAIIESLKARLDAANL
jgi:hypothetical protein